MHKLFATTAAGLLIALSGSAASAQGEAAVRAHGRSLLMSNCSQCHAIDRTDRSVHREAPPFRTLSQRYPIDLLAEALAEGLVTGHPDMPEFVFEIRDVDAILSYLRSIQEQGPSTPHNR